MLCAQCRSLLPAGARFCPTCGAEAFASPSADPEPAVTAPLPALTRPDETTRLQTIFSDAPAEPVTRGAAPVAFVVVGSLVFLAVLAVVLASFLRGGGSVASSATTPTIGAVTGPATTATRSSAPTTPATTSTRPSPVTVPASARLCATGAGPYGTVHAGTAITSCPFALAVRDAYAAAHPTPVAGTTVSATSPVTHTAYTMTCHGTPVVVCTGGTDASVYLSPR